MSYRCCKHKPTGRKMYDLAGMSFEGTDYTDWWIHGVCEYGNCVNLDCPVCGCNSGGGWGPIDCPCDDTVPYYDMRQQTPVAVKPSVSTRRRRSTR